MKALVVYLATLTPTAIAFTGSGGSSRCGNGVISKSRIGRSWSNSGSRSSSSSSTWLRVASISEQTAPYKPPPPPQKDPPSDDALTKLVAESSVMEFVPVSLADRATGFASMAVACAFVGAADLVPAPLRMLLASVLIFANFEYVFHRWVMHSDRNEFEEYQRLHITHHVETNRDMTLEDGAESDPRHIYFSAATTFASIVISTLGLGMLNGIFHLNFAATPLEAVLDTTATSALIALFHTLYWQTLHGDIHEYYTDPQSGLKRANFLSMESPYTRWVVENHVGHHVLRGKGNYNIVFPGPDYLWGTCFVNSEANTRR